MANKRYYILGASVHWCIVELVRRCVGVSLVYSRQAVVMVQTRARQVKLILAKLATNLT